MKSCLPVWLHGWLEKFIETLPDIKFFYSSLKTEDITDADYMHAKRVYKDFEIKKYWWISWFACSNQYIIVSWCIWELSKYSLKYTS